MHISRLCARKNHGAITYTAHALPHIIAVPFRVILSLYMQHKKFAYDDVMDGPLSFHIVMMIIMIPYQSSLQTSHISSFILRGKIKTTFSTTFSLLPMLNTWTTFLQAGLAVLPKSRNMRSNITYYTACSPYYHVTFWDTLYVRSKMHFWREFVLPRAQLNWRSQLCHSV